MPELPEVETTRRGLVPHVVGEKIVAVHVRENRLRWPVPVNLGEVLDGETVRAVERRAKYLLFRMDRGSMVVHLGMSGSMRVLSATPPAGKHDHVDWVLSSGKTVRYTDPRRFGSIHWVVGDPMAHPLLANLGPEPWSDRFNGDYLYQGSRGARRAVKTMLMDGRIVTGVGNIYACEALFLAGIRPTRAAGRVSRKRYDALVASVRDVLEMALIAGGTTLKDFSGVDGKPGYFSQTLHVYGRDGESCTTCGANLRSVRIGQRGTVYCPACQR